MLPDCIFCKIIAGQVDGKLLYHDDEVTAFQDAHPVTPVHVLIVPNKHIASLNELEESDVHLVGKMTLIARLIAREQGVDKSGYRLVINTGADAGQSVFHLHIHLIAGRHLGPKPI
jgi:histidine triad (HIT) family protein